MLITQLLYNLSEGVLERDEAIAKLIKTVKVAKNYHRDNGNIE